MQLIWALYTSYTFTAAHVHPPTWRRIFCKLLRAHSWLSLFDVAKWPDRSSFFRQLWVQSEPSGLMKENRSMWSLDRRTDTNSLQTSTLWAVGDVTSLWPRAAHQTSQEFKVERVTQCSCLMQWQRTISWVYTCLQLVSINYQHLELASKDLPEENIEEERGKRCGWFISSWVTLKGLRSLFSKLLDRLEISPRLRFNQSSVCLKRTGGVKKRGVVCCWARTQKRPRPLQLRGWWELAGSPPWRSCFYVPLRCSHALCFTVCCMSVWSCKHLWIRSI